MPTNAELAKEVAETGSRTATLISELSAKFDASETRMASLINSAITSAIAEAKKSIFEEVKAAVIKELNSSLELQVLKIVKPITEKLETANTRISNLEAFLAKSNDRRETDLRENNLIVSGIPIDQTDNLDCVITRISAKLGFSTTPEHRARLLNNKKTEAPGTSIIQIQFRFRDDKQLFFSNYLKSRSLCLKDVLDNTSSTKRIFINHDLTKKNAEIQKQVVKLRKLKNIAQFRIFRGKVGIKVTASDSNFQIIDDAAQLPNSSN